MARTTHTTHDNYGEHDEHGNHGDGDGEYNNDGCGDEHAAPVDNDDDNHEDPNDSGATPSSSVASDCTSAAGAKGGGIAGVSSCLGYALLVFERRSGERGSR